MQNLSTQDSVKTKQLLPDRFWIIEHNGSRIGTIQRHDQNQFIVTGTDSSIANLTLAEVEDKFDLFEPMKLNRSLLTRLCMAILQNTLPTMLCLMSSINCHCIPSRPTLTTCMPQATTV